MTDKKRPTPTPIPKPTPAELAHWNKVLSDCGLSMDHGLPPRMGKKDRRARVVYVGGSRELAEIEARQRRGSGDDKDEE